jgi:hypothetical protein
MHPPIVARELGDAERAQLGAGRRAPNAFTARRARVVLLSAAGRRPSGIAPGLCCVRGADRAQRHPGLQRPRPRAALTAGSSRPEGAAPVPDGAERERLRALVHRSVAARALGHAPRSTWALALLAPVARTRRG